jgi:hypothetical protein
MDGGVRTVDGVTNIDVPELMTIGEAVTDVADRLGRVTGEISGWESMPLGTVDGSVACAGALVDATSYWRETMTGLVEEIRGYGADLHRSAADYRAADELAARRYRESGYYWDAPGRQAAQ